MTKDSINLFKPIQVGDYTLNHRVAMAPLTRKRASIEHVASEKAAEYYSQRASYPGTLIVTEGTFMSLRSGGSRNVPGIYTKEQIDAWKPVFKAIHDRDCKSFMQIWVLGRAAEPPVLQEEGSDFIGPSDGRPVPGVKEIPRAMTKDEIKGFVQEYVDAAKNAIAAGADGIEIHDANSYLLDQFLHEDTNQRTDEYGGSIENRARFTLEVVDAIVDAIGAGKVAIRFSPWGTFRGDFTYGVSPISQFSYVIEQLEKRGRQGRRLAYLSLVEPRVMGNMDVEKIVGSNEFIEHIWSGVIMKAGGLAHSAKEVAQLDDRTIVALGRYFISNPDIVKRIENDWPLTPYDRGTFYTADMKGYIDYPFYEEGKN